MAKIDIDKEVIKQIDNFREGLYMSRKSFVEYTISYYFSVLEEEKKRGKS